MKSCEHSPDELEAIIKQLGTDFVGAITLTDRQREAMSLKKLAWSWQRRPFGDGSDDRC